MYAFTKNILKKIFPQKFIFKNELLLRKSLYLFYKGKNCECNVCGSKLEKFEKLENGNLLCPICGSLPRSRRLYKIISEQYLKDNFKTLDFSPSRSNFRNFKKNTQIKYFATDFEDEFLADYHFDITKIDIQSEYFDVVICYHVLEHIENNEAAIHELYRVTKSNGTVLIQTPFKEGSIYEDSNIKSPEDREKYFGQRDHVRIYSVEGLKQRLENAGFVAEVFTFEEDSYFGFSRNEKIIICKK